MTIPANFLQNVQTYQSGDLASLQNQGCFIGTANTKFKDFQKLTANLGTTVTYDLPYRFTTTNSLVASFQSITQRVHTLTVDQPISTSIVATAEQLVFNLEDYMDKIGDGAVKEIGTKIEANVARLAETVPFRYFGDGTTPINSFGQLGQIMADFRDFGAAKGSQRGYLPLVNVPSIINSGLNQFVPNRNEKLANSWQLGSYNDTDWYSSNLLPIHFAGNVGNDGTTLTVVSTNDPTGNNITQITFSGATASDQDAIKAFDNFTFQDGVLGKPNIRFLTFVGHEVCSQSVQIKATVNVAASSGGLVAIDISPPLSSNPGTPVFNLSTNIVAGMQVKGVPDHRCGLITSGNALFLAMPQLPDTSPFISHSEADEDTGVSMRVYYGHVFGQNQYGLIHDAIWGKDLVEEYSMKVIFPLIN